MDDSGSPLTCQLCEMRVAEQSAGWPKSFSQSFFLHITTALIAAAHVRKHLNYKAHACSRCDYRTSKEDKIAGHIRDVR